jgi:hypothetical protein
MNDTPRTNDIIEKIKCFRTSSAIYSLEQFSRLLERELTAVTEQRDRLAEALRKIKNANGTYNDPYDELDFIDGITYEVIQSLTQNQP